MMVRTNIVIISYNALEYTIATVESLFSCTDNNFYLTIVDNGSDQDTIKYLDSLKPSGHCKKIRLIKNYSNMGVGYAYNQGQQVSFSLGVEFTAFCNNDLFFSKSWLRKLESSMDGEKNIAILCPLRPSAKVKYNKSISTRDKLFQLPDVDSWQQEIELYTGLSVGSFSDFSDMIVGVNGFCKIEKIYFPDSLSTCVCLTRNSIFRTIGFFANPLLQNSYGGEDIDTCWKVMSLGYDCAVDNSVYVHHFRGKSLKSNGMNRAELLKVSNRMLYDIWERDINHFISNEIKLGKNVVEQIINKQDSRYWLLSELNNDIKFTEKYSYVVT